MEKCSQKRPRCRWLAWCSCPPAPRVTALACTACSSFPIRQTYTCGNGRSRSAEKYLYEKNIRRQDDATYQDLEHGAMRSKWGTTSSWPGRRILLVVTPLALLCFQLGALTCWCAIPKDSVLKWEIINIYGPSNQIKSADSNAMDGNVL